MRLMGNSTQGPNLSLWGFFLLPSSREGKEPVRRGKRSEVRTFSYLSEQPLGAAWRIPRALENEGYLPGGDLGVPELIWVHFIHESPFSEDISYANYR